jgi:hypothetical protein
MRIQIAVPEKHVSKPVLDAALEAVTRLNEQMIKAGDAPTSLQLLEQGARWKPEPPGQEHFDHAGRIESRGDGDCDDWAPAHAATLRVTGRDRNAVAEVRKTGPKRWHATVYRSDGREDDPSLKAGMPGPGNPGVIGAWLPLMHQSVHGVGGAFLDMPRLAMRGVPGDDGSIESWQARADLPWHWRPDANTRNPSDIAMVTLHKSPVSSTAICGAARGAFKLGLANGVDVEQLKRLSAICDLCEGAPWEDVAAMYGPEHATAAGAIVGSFFGKAFKKLGKVAKGVARGALKVASPALSLVPGGGLASAALSMASPALKKSVAKQKHAPPELRRPEGIIQPSAPVPVQAHLAPPVQQGTQYLPYPYPLPYPVPGWDGASPGPGVAWPPR